MTEKQKNCPFCHDDSYTPIVHDGWLELGSFESRFKLVTDYGSYDLPFRFCPMCGRPLGGNEDED